jgi:hypothetical protein
MLDAPRTGIGDCTPPNGCGKEGIMSEPEPQDEYMSLTHIGWEWDVSNRAIGKALEAAGYWSYGDPTNKAILEGLAVRLEGRYSWSRDAVGRFISRADLSERSNPKRRTMYLVTPLEFN